MSSKSGKYRMNLPVNGGCETKAKVLNRLVKSNKLEFIMEAHNGLSARIAEEAGFDGLWASGLAISAALGVRDSNEASWTQIVDVLEFMSDATNIPILLDGDTGYGNFNNVMRLIQKLEQRSIAGVCLEDKIFPKTNSYINSGSQKLANIDEFCGKIKAAKDAQKDDDFVVIARVESFIVGNGIDDAFTRAEAYRKAGADGILVHSKRNDVSEIVSFIDRWSNRHPIVVVPTTYFRTPTSKYRDLNISVVIWANQLIRSTVSKMQQIAGSIKSNMEIESIEDQVAPVAEIFRLQRMDALNIAEDKYLPKSELESYDCEGLLVVEE